MDLGGIVTQTTYLNQTFQKLSKLGQSVSPDTCNMVTHVDHRPASEHATKYIALGCSEVPTIFVAMEDGEVGTRHFELRERSAVSSSRNQILSNFLSSHCSDERLIKVVWLPDREDGLCQITVLEYYANIIRFIRDRKGNVISGRSRAQTVPLSHEGQLSQTMKAGRETKDDN